LWRSQTVPPVPVEVVATVVVAVWVGAGEVDEVAVGIIIAVVVVVEKVVAGVLVNVVAVDLALAQDTKSKDVIKNTDTAATILPFSSEPPLRLLFSWTR